MMHSLRDTVYYFLNIICLVALTVAYDATSNTNVALYFGQGPNETDTGLAYFCSGSSVDIIILGFLNKYPAQANGFPGSNFGGSCWKDSFTAPGYGGVNDPSKNQLKKRCPSMVSGIPICQAQGKKVLLSMGGQAFPDGYALTSEQDAEYMADFLWGAFGPIDTTTDWPRPFDTEGVVNEVDGFDFDIEHVNAGEQAYYITLINRLRDHFATGDKEYIITGAPQCIFPDISMGDIINQAQFDILFVQYYNTPQCSARNWVDQNPGFGVSTTLEKISGFQESFGALANSLGKSKSKDAKLYIGLLGSKTAGGSQDYLDPATEISALLKAYFCHPSFGGVSIFDAGYAYLNTDNGKGFQERVGDILAADSTDTKHFTCATASTASPTTTSSSRGGGGGASHSTVTTLTMTLCTPLTSSNTSLSNSSTVLYSNSSSAPYSNSTSLSPSLPITSSDITATAISSKLVSVTKVIQTKITSHVYSVYTQCTEDSCRKITGRQVEHSTTSLRSSITTPPSLNMSSTTPSPPPGNASVLAPTSFSNASIDAIPTFSFNLDSKSASPTSKSNSSHCFIVYLTMSVPVATKTVSTTATCQPIYYNARNGAFTPVSMGSKWFFVLSVGLPGVFGLSWYMVDCLFLWWVRRARARVGGGEVGIKYV